MRKLFPILLTMLLFAALPSCLDNEDEIIFSDYITLTSGELPSTVDVNTPISIDLTATAPNSCWHSIRFKHGVESDTICIYAAVAIFENHGKTCDEVPVTKDTTVTFTPTLAKSYIFKFMKSYSEVVIDTVEVVVPDSGK